MYYNSNKYVLQNPSEVRRREQERINENKYMNLHNDIQKRHLRERKFQTFVAESKDYILSEGLAYLTMKCIPKTLSSNHKQMVRNIASNFVHEEGADALLRRMSGKTIFLTEFSRITEEACKEVIHGASENIDDDFCIKQSEINKYYDGLENLGYEDMCKKITQRVAAAETDFVQSNINDKKNIENITSDAKDKIEKIQNKDRDTENEIKEEAARLYNKKLSEIPNRKRNVLESIIRHVGESAVINEDAKAVYTAEGKLDMNKVIDTAETMYTFLEMVNSLKIKNVDEKYIADVIKSIK